MTLSIIHHPSPNVGIRPAGVAIDTLVLHYTGMQSAKAALAHLCNPGTEVSAHYLIDEDGTLYQLVAEDKRAWHAGRGYWRGQENINNVSIGIELVNPGHEYGYRPFTEAQMQTLIPLCQQILARHPIPPHNVIAHSDLAPLRKQDPGELFNWQRLAQAGIGLWADIEDGQYLPLSLNRNKFICLQQRLSQLGYFIPETGCYDTHTQAVITAFKRHFVPHLLSEQWDSVSEKRLSALLHLG